MHILGTNVHIFNQHDSLRVEVIQKTLHQTVVTHTLHDNSNSTEDQRAQQKQVSCCDVEPEEVSYIFVHSLDKVASWDDVVEEAC